MEIDLQRKAVINLKSEEEIAIFMEVLRYADRHIYTIREGKGGHFGEMLDKCAEMVSALNGELMKLGEVRVNETSDS